MLADQLRRGDVVLRNGLSSVIAQATVACGYVVIEWLDGACSAHDASEEFELPEPRPATVPCPCCGRQMEARPDGWAGRWRT